LLSGVCAVWSPARSTRDRKGSVLNGLFIILNFFYMIFSLKTCFVTTYSPVADLISFGLFSEARDFTNFSRHAGLFKRGLHLQVMHFPKLCSQNSRSSTRPFPDCRRVGGKMLEDNRIVMSKQLCREGFLFLPCNN
jgi:hypothetical protein